MRLQYTTDTYGFTVSERRQGYTVGTLLGIALCLIFSLLICYFMLPFVYGRDYDSFFSSNVTVINLISKQ